MLLLENERMHNLKWHCLTELKEIDLFKTKFSERGITLMQVGSYSVQMSIV